MSKKTIEYAKKLVSQMTIDEKISQMLYESPAIERLGIPEYNWWNEALHGVARAGVATVFPQAIGLAATFDTDLIEKIGDVVSTEGRGKFNEFSKSWTDAIKSYDNTGKVITPEDMKRVMGLPMDKLSAVLFSEYETGEQKKLLDICCHLENVEHPVIDT